MKYNKKCLFFCYDFKTLPTPHSPLPLPTFSLFLYKKNKRKKEEHGCSGRRGD